MPRRTGLGRGLDALIPGSEPASRAGVEQIPVENISPNPRQPRRDFNPEELAGLAASIHENGVLQPLILSRGDQPDEYILVAGERRLLAARQAGFEVVPAIIRDVSDQQRLELALVENLQRADLNPLEASEAYRQLSEDFNLSHEEIARRVGKSRTAVTNTLRLIKLPDEVRQALIEDRISEGHARALLALPTSQAQIAILQMILDRGLNVRQTEELVRKYSGMRPVVAQKPVPAPEIIALEERLRRALGTRVSLNRRRNGGTLTIHFYSDEELNSIVDFILGEDKPG
jgi:ParB family chromosome partitioning protein